MHLSTLFYSRERSGEGDSKVTGCERISTDREKLCWHLTHTLKCKGMVILNRFVLFMLSSEGLHVISHYTE